MRPCNLHKIKTSWEYIPIGSILCPGCILFKKVWSGLGQVVVGTWSRDGRVYLRTKIGYSHVTHNLF